MSEWLHFQTLSTIYPRCSGQGHWRCVALLPMGWTYASVKEIGFFDTVPSGAENCAGPASTAPNFSPMCSFWKHNTVGLSASLLRHDSRLNLKI